MIRNELLRDEDTPFSLGALPPSTLFSFTTSQSGGILVSLVSQLHGGTQGEVTFWSEIFAGESKENLLVTDMMVPGPENFVQRPREQFPLETARIASEISKPFSYAILA